MHTQRASNKRRRRHWWFAVVFIAVHSASETSLTRTAPFSTAAATASSRAPAGSTAISKQHVWQPIETEDIARATTSAVRDHGDIDGHEDLQTWATKRHAALQFSPQMLACVDCFFIVGGKTRAILIVRGWQRDPSWKIRYNKVEYRN
jgi:hypothetical protein